MHLLMGQSQEIANAVKSGIANQIFSVTKRKNFQLTNAKLLAKNLAKMTTLKWKTHNEKSWNYHL